jgi:putative spermidine/putrescine transport system ATP-binding protein
MADAAINFRELRLDRVSRNFGTLNVLRDITLTVKRGEFVCLLGPSGCGKSTALNCIAGLLPATAGSIWLDDKRIDNLRPEQRGFGMVFQNYALFPHMTARKNVGFGLLMRGTPKAEAARRVDDAIALVRLGGQADKLPGQMSGGQQQRVAIARAIVIEPPLVLMDEPLSNLDAKLRLEMRAEIRRIHDEHGAATIYVTHDQDEALSMADRIVVIREGMVRQIGTPRELYAAPAHLDVAEFMGFRNRFSGKITAVDGDRVTASVGPNAISGIARNPVAVGDAVTVAVRPDDMKPVDASMSGFAATVTASEYRGRDYFGLARTPDGADLAFRAPGHIATGTAIHLGASEEHVLVFAGAA